MIFWLKKQTFIQAAFSEKYFGAMFLLFFIFTFFLSYFLRSIFLFWLLLFFFLVFAFIMHFRMRLWDKKQIFAELQEYKKLPENIFVLKKQEYLLRKLFFSISPEKIFKNSQKWPFGEYYIEWELINFDVELKKIEEKIQEYKVNFWHLPMTAFHENVFEIFENISHKGDIIRDSKMITHEKVQLFSLLKNIYLGFLMTFVLFVWYVTIIFYSHWSFIIENFSNFSFGIFSMFLLFSLFIALFRESWSHFSPEKLQNNFIPLKNASIQFVGFLKDSEYSPENSLIFTEFVKFLTENISLRTYNILEFERQVRSNFSFFPFRLAIPENILAIISEERRLLHDSSILIKEIIATFSKIEAENLKKFHKDIVESDLIMVSSKRRELLISNFEKLAEK